MAFQMPAATGATAAFAPAAGAPVTAAGAALAAAPSTAVAPSSPAASVRSGVESYSALLSCVQDAWSGSMPLDVLRRTLMQHINSMATVQEQRPNAADRALIESKNVEVDGVKVNLSDERTVQFILDMSNLLQITELESLRLVFAAAASLSATDASFGRGSGPQVQYQLRARATELYFQRRFNLLLATLDLVLMERAGADDPAAIAADGEAGQVRRVVAEAVAELVRLGITSNVMACVESMHTLPAAPTTASPAAADSSAHGAALAPLPDVSAYRALELSYLLRLLFALFKPSGSAALGGLQGVDVSAEAGSEDLIRLVEHIQNRSAALSAAAAAKAQAQAQLEQQAKQQQQMLYGGQMFGALVGSMPMGSAATAAVANAAPDHASTFNCYVLLCTLMEGLEVKYRSIAQSLEAGARPPTTSSSAAAAAAQANADADLYHFVQALSRRISNPSNWSHDVFRCGTLLVWSLFLKRVRLLQPGGQTVAESEEEVQQLVLEGLGGAENQGFWIHLHETMRHNPAFAGLRKNVAAAGGLVEEEEAEADADGEGQGAAQQSAAASGAAPGASGVSATLLSSSNPSSASLLEELGEVLGEFVHHVLLLHGKEMDLLRREDKKTSQAYTKAAARHAALLAQQAQQAQVQSLQQYGAYGAHFGGGSGGGVGAGGAAAGAAIVVGEAPQPPVLNFSAFLGVLSSLARSIPALVPLLWSSPSFESFLRAELHDSKTAPGVQGTPSRLGLAGSAGAGSATPGSLLSGSSAGGSNGGYHSSSSSSSSSIFTSDSPFVLGYLDLLGSLCPEPASALRVYSFLRGCSRVNWEMICVSYLQQGLIQHYTPAPPVDATMQPDSGYDAGMRRGYGASAAQYRVPPAAVAPPPLSQRQLRLLSSLLRLLSSLVRRSPMLQSFFGQHGEFRLLDTAFGLLALKLPVGTKARVLELLAALTRLNADMALAVWERLERSQILPTVHFAMSSVAAAAAAQQAAAGGLGSSRLLAQAPSLVPSGAPLEGLLFDLEEVENQLQLYPLTAAFLHLLVTLLESGPLPARLGEGVRGMGSGGMGAGQQTSLSSSSSAAAAAQQGLFGLAPYTSFVHAHVFLNLPHRAYQRPAEQFVLAELALATFARLVAEFLRDMSAMGAGGAVRVADASGSASFQARHQSLQFASPDVQPDAREQQAALAALAAHPAYPLLRDLLSGKEVLGQTLLQLHNAHAQLEQEGAMDPATGAVHPAVEGTLLQALRLLWLILEKEEALVNVLQGIEAATHGGKTGASSGAFLFSAGALAGSVSSLSGLFLQHQSSVLTLAKCMGHIQSHTDTPVQQLLRDRMAKDKARQAAAGVQTGAALNQSMPSSLGLQSQYGHNNNSTLMFEHDEEDDPLLAAAAAAAAAAPLDASESLEDGRTSEAAFYAASAMLLLSQRDEARIVHILEAAGLSALVVAACRRQIKNVQLPSAGAESAVGSAESRDPDLQCNRARLVIVDLLLSSLSNPSPATPHLSLALLLLGFDIATPAAVRGTDLLRSGRRDLLDTLLFDQACKAGFASRFPSLAQGTFRMLFQLVSSPLTSAPVLRLIKAHPSAGGAGVAGFLLSLLRGLPIVADIGGMMREWRADEAALSLTSGGGIALMRSSALSNRVYHSLFQLSWLLRTINLHYFVLVGAQARARAASGQSTAAPQEEWLLDEEVQMYLHALGFLAGADEDDNAAAAAAAGEDSRLDRTGADWFGTGAQSASSFMEAVGGTSSRFGSAGAAGRPMLLLDVLSNLDTFLRAVLPPSFQLESPPADSHAAAGLGDGAGGSGSSSSSNGGAAAGVTFELASTKYYDAQHCAIQYSLSDVYSGCVSAGLSASVSLAATRRCLEWNLVSSVLGCSKAAFEAWKQSVEVVLLNSAAVLMRADAAAFESTLLRLLQSLLSKLAAARDHEDQSLSIWVALGEEVSNLALTIISALRDVHRYTTGACAGAAASSGAAGWGEGAGVGGSSRAAQWHTILSLLVSSLLGTRHSATRANLYAVFLQYILLSLSRRQSVERAIAAAAALDTDESGEGGADHSLWSAIQAEQARCDAANLALLSSHNLPLLTLVVNDALDGASKLRGLSFRFLNVLLLGAAASSNDAPVVNAQRVQQEAPSRFFNRGAATEDATQLLPSQFTSSLLTLFGRNNLLLSFLNQLKASDAAVETAIHASGARALQGYELLLHAEASLGFILQLSLDPAGARLLQEHQTVRVLASLTFLHSRPAPSYGYAGAESETSGAAGAGQPTPLDKFLSVHVLALQIIGSMLRAMPGHAALLAHAQHFVASTAQQEALAAVLAEARHAVNQQSLEGLAAALALLYQGAKAERIANKMAASDSTQEQQQSKLQKLSGGTRFTPQRGGSTALVESSGAPAQPFTSFVQKQQGALLTLLSRYFHPFEDVRLRAYLSALNRERREKLDAGVSPAALDAEGADAESAALPTDTLLEQGDAAVQRVCRKVLALLTLPLTVSGGASSALAAAPALFGPRLGEGDLRGGGYADSRDAAGSDPAHPDLDALVGMVKEAQRRLHEAQRQQMALRNSLSVLAQAASPAAAVDAFGRNNTAFDSGASNGVGADGRSSALAALELEFFPPSAASAGFYEDLDPVQRGAQLRAAVVRALQANEALRSQHVWTLEHALLLLYQHVRLYLPATSLGSSQRGGAQTAAEFRQAAEQSLVPILLELLQALTPATKYGGGMDGAARGAFGGVNGGAADSQSLTLYGGGASQALVLSTGTASRLAPSGTDVSNSSAFLTAMLQRILKHITG